MTTSDNSVPLRPLVRTIMKLAPARKWSEAALLAQIRTSIPDAAENDVLAALLWNSNKGHVTSSYMEELEVDVWQITTRGMNA